MLSLDTWVREVFGWHFIPSTGCPFWIDFAKAGRWDPRRETGGLVDRAGFGEFHDNALRGGPVERRISKGLAGKRVFVFETGGTGVPRTRVAREETHASYPCSPLGSAVHEH